MRNIFKLLSIIAGLLFFAACKKDEARTILHQGTFFTTVSSGLTASDTSIVLDSANASTAKAVTFNWPVVSFGDNVTVSYTLQVDSVAGKFAKPVNVSVGSSLSLAYTKVDFNTLAQSLGLVTGVAGKLIVRVKADVNQSNGAASTVPGALSNTLTLTVTTYSNNPPPKYPVPANLYLIGSATPGGDAHGWDNPVPVPSQQFTQIDATTFGIVLPLIGGKEFVFLPKNGDWGHKYAITGTGDPAGGAFEPDAAKNMAGPVTDGLYKIIVDFVKGTYTTTPAVAGVIPTNLFIIGNATPGGDTHGWDNPVPVPSQQFTRVSSGEYSITLPLIGGKAYLFLPVNGDWTHKYGGTSKTGGPLLADNNVPSTNTPAPDVSGTYTIDVNFFSGQYTVK
jgi:starch-binding outer membrane protein SusE/F